MTRIMVDAKVWKQLQEVAMKAQQEKKQLQEKVDRLSDLLKIADKEILETRTQLDDILHNKFYYSKEYLLGKTSENKENLIKLFNSESPSLVGFQKALILGIYLHHLAIEKELRLITQEQYNKEYSNYRFIASRYWDNDGDFHNLDWESILEIKKDIVPCVSDEIGGDNNESI